MTTTGNIGSRHPDSWQLALAGAQGIEAPKNTPVDAITEETSNSIKAASETGNAGNQNLNHRSHPDDGQKKERKPRNPPKEDGKRDKIDVMA